MSLVLKKKCCCPSGAPPETPACCRYAASIEPDEFNEYTDFDYPVAFCIDRTNARMNISAEIKSVFVEVAGDHTADILTSGYTVISTHGIRFERTGIKSKAYGTGSCTDAAIFEDSGASGLDYEEWDGSSWSPVSLTDWRLNVTPAHWSYYQPYGTEPDAAHIPEGFAWGYDLRDDSGPVYKNYADQDGVVPAQPLTWTNVGSFCGGTYTTTTPVVRTVSYEPEFDLTTAEIILSRSCTIAVTNNFCCYCKTGKCLETATARGCNEDGSTVDCGSGELSASCGPPNPITVEVEDYPTAVAIDGYSNTFFGVDPAWGASGAAAWDGILNYDPYVSSANRWRTSGTLSINGVALTVTTTQAYAVDVGGGVSEWYLIVMSGANEIWRGKKTTGVYPLGTYTRISGYDTTATIDLV
jgi:hypothetical protein